MLKKTITDYSFPEDLMTMNDQELGLLAYEIRDFLIENISRTGGHLASNLGVVELTIALHRVFDSPRDKIIWDVGHQSYIHKILTGRAADMGRIRCYNGISGFPKRCESEHDCFDTGHSSTSISAAAGFAAARDLKGEDHQVIAVIGDGALTGGLAYEGLNNAGDSGRRMIVVLNDNEMSIGRNTGGIARHLSKLRASNAYQDFKRQLKKTLKGIPGVGRGLYSGAEHLRDSIKYAMVPGAVFEELGFTYLGPVDGHKLPALMETLSLAKTMPGPVLVHVLTQKGKGYRNAETDPDRFHGVSPFDPATGVSASTAAGLTFSQVFGRKLMELAGRDPRIVAISAAMVEGTGLAPFRAEFPDRLFDVGIAESHSVTFAAGLAQSGLRPVVAVYSTFLQRAYDQILMDVCLQNLPVVFAIDRAGNVGQDGETHHGIFDLSYLSSMPNLTIFTPRDGGELEEALEKAMALPGPCAVRYPRGGAGPVVLPEEPERGEGALQLWAVGHMAAIGIQACRLLREQGVAAEPVCIGQVKPLSLEMLPSSLYRARRIITLEDNIVTGGFGQQLRSFLDREGMGDIRVTALGWPDKFIEHGSVSQLLAQYGLDEAGVAERVRNSLEG